MRRIQRTATLAVAGALCAATSFATDRWESPGDGGQWSFNTLHHGIPQVGHDLEGLGATPDQDWYDVNMQRGHSYEAIAEKLECDTKTVDNALQRVKRKVGAHLASREVAA